MVQGLVQGRGHPGGGRLGGVGEDTLGERKRTPWGRTPSWRTLPSGTPLLEVGGDTLKEDTLGEDALGEYTKGEDTQGDTLGTPWGRTP